MVARLLYQMAWIDAKRAFQQTRLALVPIGSVEQHGPHMPLGTDFMIAEYLAKAAGERLDAIITPVIPIGYAAYHADFPGTLSVSKQTLTAYVGEFCAYLVKYGITHIIFVNGHGGNGGPLDTVGQTLRDQGIAVANFMWWESAPGLDSDWSPNGHGDAIEGSMILAIEPETFRKDRAALPVNKKLTTSLQALDGSNVSFGRGQVRVALRVGDVSDTGNMLEYGLNDTANFTRSPADANERLGREMLDGLAEYLVAFGREFLDLSFRP